MKYSTAKLRMRKCTREQPNNLSVIFLRGGRQPASHSKLLNHTATSCLKLFDPSGQTGSGKTFTMLDEQNGLYVLAGRDIFKLLKLPEFSNLVAFVSFYEIYQRF